MLKDMDFFLLQENINNKYWIRDQILSKKQFIKQVNLQRKKADAVTKSNDDNIEKQEPVEEIIIPPEKKKEEILNKLRRVL